MESVITSLLSLSRSTPRLIWTSGEHIARWHYCYYLAVAEPGPEAIVLGHRVVMPTDLDFRLQAEMAAGRWRFPAATEN